MKINRRNFLKSALTLGGAAVAFPTIIPSSVLGRNGKVAPSNRVCMAFIGTGNQGSGDMNSFLHDSRVQVVAICDVNRESDGYWDNTVRGREPARRMVDGFYSNRKDSGNYKGCAVYADFLPMIARPDSDAVEVATPDHWHALLAVECMKAGKAVYNQKPLALTIWEGRQMANAAKKYGAVFQCGSQQRSERNFRLACEFVLNGGIGKLHTVKCGLPGGWPDFGKSAQFKTPTEVPDGFNYDFWLGPAPAAPYCKGRVGVNFRWIRDYSGGQITDWGGHHPDIAQWGMGTQYTGPVEVLNAKGSCPKDALYNTFTEYYCEYMYDNGVRMIISDKLEGGVTFEGTDGTVWVNRGGLRTTDKAGNKIDLYELEEDEFKVKLYQSDNHYRNFIDCIYTGNECIAPAEVAHRSITLSHLGNIAMTLGASKLKWDPVKEEFIGNDDANKMLKREYREPWVLKV